MSEIEEVTQAFKRAKRDYDSGLCTTDVKDRPPIFLRLRDEMPVDQITTEVVPRYITSELSGDEWRFSVVVKMLYKGKLVKSFTTGTMEDAANRMSEYYRKATYFIDYKKPEGTEELCQSPGCRNEATVVYRLKKTFCDCGKKSQPYSNWHRRFCRAHSTRGDCGLEDDDKNYERVEGETQEVEEEAKSRSAIMIVN